MKYITNLIGDAKALHSKVKMAGIAAIVKGHISFLLISLFTEINQ
jgi:hypothetical protein